MKLQMRRIVGSLKLRIVGEYQVAFAILAIIILFGLSVGVMLWRAESQELPRKQTSGSQP